MCVENEEGKYPTCLEAKFDGPGCEGWSLCYECADALRRLLQAAKQRLWAVILVSGGTVRVPEHTLVFNDWADYELREFRDPPTGDHVLSLEKVKSSRSGIDGNPWAPNKDVPKSDKK